MGTGETYVDILTVVAVVRGKGWIMIMSVVRSTRQGSLLPVKILGPSVNNDMPEMPVPSRVFVNTKEKRMSGRKRRKGEEKRSQPKLMAEVRERREKKVGNERTRALLSSTMQAG